MFKPFFKKNSFQHQKLLRQNHQRLLNHKDIKNYIFSLRLYNLHLLAVNNRLNYIIYLLEELDNILQCFIV